MSTRTYSGYGNGALVPPLRSSVFLNTILLLSLAVALVLPSILWALRDWTIWTWDQANYGTMVLRNVQAARISLSAWQESLMAPSITAPLLVWTAQLFVPLAYVIGRIEPALLMTNVAFAGLTLVLVGRVSLLLTRSRSATAVALFVCASAPMFVGITQTFLAESAQIMAVAVLMNAAYDSARLNVRVSIPRFVAAMALAMLAKFSSFLLVAPFLVYFVVTICLTRGDSKQPSIYQSTVEAIVALTIVASTAYWYLLNWGYVIAHARRATVSEVALFYGTSDDLLTKMHFWLTSLAAALTPFSPLALSLLAIVVLALTWSAYRMAKILTLETATTVIHSGYLFALCLAGTIVAILVTYSLQINEDTRFLAPLLPVIATLVGWAVGACSWAIPRYLAIAILAANYVAAQLISLGLTSSTGVTAYLAPPRQEKRSIERMSHALSQTCTNETYQRTLFIAVSLPDFNVNSINFEARKSERARGFACNYASFEVYGTDTASSLRQIEELGVNTILTLPEVDLPGESNPYFFANKTAAPVAIWLAKSPRFKRVSLENDNIVVYQRRQL
jgi:hypothetical protein